MGRHCEYRDCAQHYELSDQKRPATEEFTAKPADLGGVESELDVVNLVASEQPVGGPEREGDEIDAARDDIVGAGSSRCQPDSADHLSRHPHLAAEQLHARLYCEHKAGNC